jgi:NAD(P)-dependent dehydrogenase (short-subunit alcohol dehydrogenase family)
MSYVEEMFGLAGKTAVITGGGGVIAGALAEAFLKAGANVALWNRSSGSMEAVAEAVRAACPESADSLAAVVADTGNEEAVKAALEETVKRFGRVDILINGVGGNKGKGAFVDVDIALFEDVLRLNLLAGLVIPTKIVAAWWIEKKIAGSIINMSSMTSYIPLSGVWAYDAAKAGVINLTMGAAKEFAPYGIRVNGIAPGFFLGRQNKALLMDEETGNLTERGQAIIDHTPFGRFGEVNELSGATLFLASSAAAGFVTGVTIPVDGGYLIHNI